MKFSACEQLLHKAESCPSRGTWIEIVGLAAKASAAVSCPSRGTWIEIKGFGEKARQIMLVIKELAFTTFHAFGRAPGDVFAFLLAYQTFHPQLL